MNEWVCGECGKKFSSRTGILAHNTFVICKRKGEGINGRNKYRNTKGNRF